MQTPGALTDCTRAAEHGHRLLPLAGALIGHHQRPAHHLVHRAPPLGQRRQLGGGRGAGGQGVAAAEVELQAPDGRILAGPRQAAAAGLGVRRGGRRGAAGLRRAGAALGALGPAVVAVAVAGRLLHAREVAKGGGGCGAVLRGRRRLEARAPLGGQDQLHGAADHALLVQLQLRRRQRLWVYGHGQHLAHEPAVKQAVHGRALLLRDRGHRRRRRRDGRGAGGGGHGRGHAAAHAREGRDLGLRHLGGGQRAVQAGLCLRLPPHQRQLLRLQGRKHLLRQRPPPLVPHRLQQHCGSVTGGEEGTESELCVPKWCHAQSNSSWALAAARGRAVG